MERNEEGPRIDAVFRKMLHQLISRLTVLITVDSYAEEPWSRNRPFRHRLETDAGDVRQAVSVRLEYLPALLDDCICPFELGAQDRTCDI